MTKEEKIKLVESRIRFLSVWKEIVTRRKAFEPMRKIFNLLEADYTKCIIPDDKEMVYRHFKDESFERIVPIKLGKYLVKHYKDLVPADHVLADFVGMLNAIIWKKPPSIVVYKGDDLIEVYKRCNDSKKVGTCMSRYGKYEYMKLLAQNPDKVEVHSYEDNEDIYARVLVWTLDDGKRVVDRIYPNSGDHFHTMLEHFKNLDNYYIRSNHNIADSKNEIYVEGLDNPTIRLVENKDDHIKNYPYLDTFQYSSRHDSNMELEFSVKRLPNSEYKYDCPYGTPNFLSKLN